MLAFVSYPSIYSVAIGDKPEKERKAENKTEVRLKLFCCSFSGERLSRVNWFL